MKRIFIALVVLLATSFALHGSAYAAPSKPHSHGCWPVSACGGTNPVPDPAPVSSNTVTVLTKLSTVGSAVIADVQAADALASTPIPNSNPPAIWDPIAHACYPTLITFIQSLPSPASLPTAGSGGGLITIAEQVRIANIAAQQAIATIATVGYPTALKMACDPLILDTQTQAINGAAAVTLFIAALLPK